MLRIRDFPIRTKLTLMNMLVSGAALLLACVSFVAYDQITVRQTLVRSLSIQAQIVGSNSVSAIAFDDAAAAEVNLAGLRAKSSIVAAGIYSANGRPLAVYRRNSGKQALPLPPIPAAESEAHWFEEREVALVHTIEFQGKTTGVVYIRSDLREIDTRLKRYAAVVGVVLLTSLFAAFVLSSIVRRAVAQPIDHLADVARIVSRDKNYSVRAAASGNHDEMAVLIGAFNEMLAQIQERDGALQEAQERLSLALRSSGVGTWNLGLMDHCMTMDEYLAPLLGLQPGSFSGDYHAFLGLIHQQDRQRVAREIEGAKGDVPYAAQFQVVWPDGSGHDLNMRGKVYRDQSETAVRMTGVCWDITDLRRAENEVKRLNEGLERRVAERTLELEAANKELEAFTYSVAHDLRAPLRHVHGFSKILAEEYKPQLDAAALEYLDGIMEDTENMGRLIDDLLNLGRLGRQELKLELTGLNSLVDEVLRDLKSEMKGRDIEWRIGDLPFVECDPGLMKQVFSNLIANAIKYTRPRKRAVIEVDQITTGEQATVFVRDNGVGFNMKYADKLFGVFQRLHRKEDFEGTGVGLATVQRILHKHGGRIWAEAALDKGAAFYFIADPVERTASGVGAEAASSEGNLVRTGDRR